MGAGRLLIIAGLLLIVLGAAVSLSSQFPFHLGRLPGDIFIQKEKFTFSFPLTTCILLSLLLTLLVHLFSRFFHQ